MMTVLLIARAVGRPGDSLHFLAMAFIALLMANPLLLGDPGFQLSFAATFGIVILVPAWEEALLRTVAGLRLPGPALTGLVFSAAAQAATLPLILWHFGGVSILSLGANLVAVPLVAAAVPAGFLALGAGMVWLPAGLFLGKFVGLLLAIMDEVVTWFASWPWAYADLARPPFWGAVLFYLGLYHLGRAGILHRFGPGGGGSSRRRIVDGTVLILMILVLLRPPSLPLGTKLEVAFLDVGQGDAIVLHLPRGRTMVIDGGPPPRQPGSQWTPLEDYLRYRGVRRLDILVLTHGDIDHVGSLEPVIRKFRPREVWFGRAWVDGMTRLLLAAAVEEGGRLRPLTRGDTLRPVPDVTLEVLNPGPRPFTGTGADDNNNSVVLRLVHDRVTVLFTADLEGVGEEILMRSGRILRSDVLKVGHHGSRSSTTEGFVTAVAPRIAVVQVGKNPYGHPHPTVLDRLEGTESAVLRTDQRGAVILRSDGRRLRVAGTRR